MCQAAGVCIHTTSQQLAVIALPDCLLHPKIQDPNLSGITVIAADRAYVTLLGTALRQAAQHRLRNALQSMNQVHMRLHVRT